jgi:hypothetical protein
MKHIKIFIPIVCLLMFTACTKVVKLDLGNASGRLVIEGNITNSGAAQVIKLSTNVPFTNTNTYPAVSGATVSVTDQTGKSYAFTEGQAGIYTNNLLKGIPGNRYTMSVLTGGVTYTAASTMPAVVNLDSVVSKNRAITSGSNPTKQISVYYHDPAGIANQYLFNEYINGAQIQSIFAFNDQFNDGLATNVVLRQGGTNNIDVHAGDNVTVEMQCIDPTVYLYWLTLSQQSGNAGAGVTPSDPPTNITPAALGYFSAHTTQTKIITAK